MRRVVSLIALALIVAGCGSAQGGSGRIGKSKARPAAVAAQLPDVRVGAPGPPVTCTHTIGQGAAIQGALVAAHPGDAVCLSPGDYGDVELTGIDHPGNVTLAAAPGAVVHLSSLSFVGPQVSANLTVQGLSIDSGVAVRTGTPGGLVFQHDTVRNTPRGYAFYFYANGSSSGHYTQTGVTMLDNEIDHVGTCLEIDGGAEMVSNFTFSRNVCGPGIGAGATGAAGASHYVQAGGITGLTVAGNAFLGPMDSGFEAAGLHNNVLHVFGDASRILFSRNLMWHTQSRGQTVLLEEGRLDDVVIDNNLDVEDPGCDVRGQCAGYAIDIAPTHGLTVHNNTIVDSFWGVLLTRPLGGYPSGSGYNIAHNLVVGTKGHPGISYGQCSSACAVSYNVTDDRSARVQGSTHELAGWVPRFDESRWTPSVPYVAPPAGYWRANGLPWTAGYQGAVGP